MEHEEHAALLLAGGIMLNGYQCGMLWGAVLAAGAQAYRLLGSGPQAEAGAIIAAQRLVESFRSRKKYINCLEITGIEMKLTSRRRLFKQMFKFFIKGGPVGCFSLAARYAPAAISEINRTFAGEQIETPRPPVSCAAMLAQKMGVSDLHTVMVAGFAGGIGLCGGACGALGAAIWILGMNSGKEGAGKIDYKNPSSLQAIDRFLINSGSEFECSKIVGRRFADIGEHADYLRAGGCAELIEALAAV